MLKNKWVNVFNTPTHSKLRLICFPYAGGAAHVFDSWRDHLPNDVQLCGLQMPGRSSRFTEQPFTNMPKLIDTLERELAPFLNEPFAFFGHSLGAAIAFEMARRFQQMGVFAKAVFVSGRRAPHLPRRIAPIHQLSEPEFRKKIVEYNGTPAEVMEHEELMELLMPLIRADFTLSETYVLMPASTLEAPLFAFGGDKDPLVDADEIEPWSQHTNGPFRSHIIEGDHFFLNGNQEALLAKINAHLLEL